MLEVGGSFSIYAMHVSVFLSRGICKRKKRGKEKQIVNMVKCKHIQISLVK